MPLEMFYISRGRGGTSSYCKECSKERAKEWQRSAKGVEYRRKRSLFSRFGITHSKYEEMLDSQDGLCAVCGERCPTGRRLAVDHCHKSGKIRGLLCLRCNTLIGSSKDSVDVLRTAADYLEKENDRRSIS